MFCVKHYDICLTPINKIYIINTNYINDNTHLIFYDANEEIIFYILQINAFSYITLHILSVILEHLNIYYTA